MFGAKLFNSPTKETNYTYNVIGKNSEIFTEGDIVTTGTSGMHVATSTDAILGVIAKTQTMSATNQSVEKVTPAFEPVDQDYEYLMGTNADLDKVASPYAYFKLTGGTGAQVVDVTTGPVAIADAQVVVTKVDPTNIGGTGVGSGLRKCTVKFVKIINSHN